MQWDQSEEHELPTGVGLTAFLVAQARAAESSRSDRLFDDPLAKAFVSAAQSAGLFDDDPLAEVIIGTAQSAVPSQPDQSCSDGAEVYSFLREYVAIRTRFFDDYLFAACTGSCRQVVVLAAGLDARAFRLAWPEGVELFELDLPEVLRFKERVIAAQGARPACRRTVVHADLREDWLTALLSAGFKPRVPTAWLGEGILSYLTDQENDQVMAKVSQLSTPGSELAVNYTNPAARDSLMESLPHTLGVLLKLFPQQQSAITDPKAWLAHHGWQAEVFDPADLAVSYGRSVPPLPQVSVAGPAVGGMVKAVREAT